MIGFCIWIAAGFALHCTVLKKYEFKRQNLLLNYIMYFPSRISFAVWGPWIAKLAGSNLQAVNDNIQLVDEVKIMNKCLDQYSRVNVDQVSSELNEAKRELKAIYVTFWFILGLIVMELLVWVVHGCKAAMEKTRKHHMERNLSDCSTTYDKSAVNQSQMMPPAPPMYQAV